MRANRALIRLVRTKAREKKGQNTGQRQEVRRRGRRRRWSKRGRVWRRKRKRATRWGSDGRRWKGKGGGGEKGWRRRYPWGKRVRERRRWERDERGGKGVEKEVLEEEAMKGEAGWEERGSRGG